MNGQGAEEDGDEGCEGAGEEKGKANVRGAAEDSEVLGHLVGDCDWSLISDGIESEAAEPEK